MTEKIQKNIDKNMNKWDYIEYQKIIDAKIDDGFMSITFANKDRVGLFINTLLPNQYEIIEPENILFSDYDISIRATPEDVVVSWDRIRVLSDRDFAKEMVRLAEANNKLTGLRLKALREKKHIKSGDLALISGVTPQTISRIEKGHTDVSFGTLRKILAAMGCSLKDLASQETLQETLKPISTFNEILKKLNKIGLGTSIINKILPSEILNQVSQRKDALPELLINEITFHLNRIFGWIGTEILENEQLSFNESPAQIAYFKTPSKGNINQIKAYSHYAFYLANIVNNINVVKPSIDYPSDLEEFKTIFYKKYQQLNLENLINYSWDLGICIIPLNDQGVFHGASWNIEGKHVIILKQRTQAHARWIFDLLHELYHVFVHLEQSNTSVIEIEELNPYSNNNSIEEKEANAFADQFIFNHKAEEIVHKSLETANYKLDLLKKAAIAISKQTNIGVDFIANYLAFRLQMNEKNWWGSANSLQIIDPDPFYIAKKILSERVSIENLNTIDKTLLVSALN